MLYGAETGMTAAMQIRLYIIQNKQFGIINIKYLLCNTLSEVLHKNVVEVFSKPIKVRENRKLLKYGRFTSGNKQVLEHNQPYFSLSEGLLDFFMYSLSRVIFPIHKPLSLAPV